MTQVIHAIPTDNLPQYDELYVISDLHFGGTPGFQIFNAKAELVQLIKHLQSAGPTLKVGLVINGDFVDFLAEKQPTYFDPANAVDKLNRIAREEPAFAPVFEALKKFTATKNRFLVVNLGNHDLELALPWVRDQLLSLLSGDNEAAKGRISLAFEGTGFLCQVGEAKVLCVHGNEVDNWNLTDHERIRRIGREVVQGRPVTNWIPNAGTQLVIDVMNDLKKTYPFIDLLKPEQPAVVPTLLALAPEQLLKIEAIGTTLARKWWDGLRRTTGFLGKEDEPDNVQEKDLGPLASPFTSEITNLSRRVQPGNGGATYAENLLLETEKRFLAGQQPISLVDQDQQGEYLGSGRAVWRFFRGEDKSEVLREALEKLKDDKSFDLDSEDETFRDLDDQIGAEIDFLIAGHTHLARAIRRKRGMGWYFNTGTWIRLIQLKKGVLDSKEKFKKVFEVFKNGKMEDLDAFPDLVMRQLMVAKISREGGETAGELLQARLGKEAISLTPAPNSRFVKK